MNKIRILLLISALVTGGITLGATHIVGGEITYKCLGDSLYEIKLSVYRDCYNGVPPFDDPAALGIANANYKVFENILISWTQTDDTLDIYLNNPCLTRPPDICVHRTTYTTIVKLPPSPGGYKLIYQRCCRNKLIRNIPFPEAVGITIISEITDKSLQECNNSAVYNNWPPLAICAHEPIDFDHSATDPDGDSLVYRLCTPLSGGTPDIPQPIPPNDGPYDEITWLPPYDLTNLLSGDPLKIDPKTGFMTGIPAIVGNFVVGVCVDEYRDSVLISTTRRDFQYNVADCGVPVAAFVSPVKQCDTLQVNFKNLSDLNSLGTSDWYFDWDNHPSWTSTAYSPTFTYPDTGMYKVALITNAGYTCADTAFALVWITKTVADAKIALEYGPCNENGLVLYLMDQSTDAQFGISYINWFVSGPNMWSYSSSASNTEITLQSTGDYYVQLTATGGNGCQDEVTVPVNVPYIPGEQLSAVYTICKGDSLYLFPDADKNLTYQWSPSSDITDLTQSNPRVGPNSTTTYTVSIMDANSPCIWTKMIDVQVILGQQLIASAVPTMIYKGETSQLTADFPLNVTYNWSPAGSLSNPNIMDPVASPEETTDYTVVVSTTSGCTLGATVRVIVLSPVCEEPFVFFPTGFSPNGDGENDALKMEGRYATEVYWMIYNRWGEKVFESNSLGNAWDGTYKGKALPAETYGYYYRIKCAGGELRERKGNVTLIR